MGVAAKCIKKMKHFNLALYEERTHDDKGTELAIPEHKFITEGRFSVDIELLHDDEYRHDVVKDIMKNQAEQLYHILKNNYKPEPKKQK